MKKYNVFRDAEGLLNIGEGETVFTIQASTGLGASKMLHMLIQHEERTNKNIEDQEDV